MTDIVTRLRHLEKWSLHGGEPVDLSDFREAADEIERLRAISHPTEAATRIVSEDELLAGLVEQAATRENGETGCVHCDKGVPVQFGQHFIKPGASSMYSERCTALSTHQQQGAESELVKRLRDEALHLRHRPPHKALMLEAADALSRAPQPDTVTEERLAELSVQFCKEQNLFISIEAQARLVGFAQFVTAALAARGKAG